eukprot:gnl/MRDRNA2_/MRDRNA2_190565_c0_seq1.p1 gnl/MRDRNA2_/MRDRNA2_190565_c0~~gnl/MRDRNA2_/MRDRNA2_190565_c0_seq1.p1  ORF type:complete len:234 (+),score=26.16 gnl/MRDRNA2_/MRDRNA2_190565_c0_seq1:103-804(+)
MDNIEPYVHPAIAVVDATGGIGMAAEQPISSQELLIVDTGIGCEVGCAVASPYNVVQALLRTHDDGTMVYADLFEGPLRIYSPVEKFVEPPDDAPSGDLHKVAKAYTMIQLNAFGTPTELGQVALLPYLRILNHSCAPNCESRIRGGVWELWSLKEIQVGEEITHTYIQDESFLACSVAGRRAFLQKRWGWCCMCVRCVHEDKHTEKCLKPRRVRKRPTFKRPSSAHSRPKKP